MQLQTRGQNHPPPERSRRPSGRAGAVRLMLAALVACALGVTLALPLAAQEQAPVRERLEDEKLREEIRNLQRERSLWAMFPSYAGVLTGIAAIATLFLTARQHLRQRSVELQRQEAEAVRRLDELFNNVVTNLGSDSPALQASAAVSLLSFLRDDPPAYGAYHEQVFWLLVAQLKVDHGREVNQLLVRVFERAVRLYLAESEARGVELGDLDLSRALLKRVDLSGLESLPPLDVAFARLDGANLRHTRLRQARGFNVCLEGALLSGADLSEARLKQAVAPRAVFHDAFMAGVKLQKAVLTKAQFQRARLQSAHLQGADLTGANFQQADVNDTFFQGATLDTAALRTLATGAHNGDKAHFDPATQARIDELQAAATPTGEMRGDPLE